MTRYLFTVILFIGQLCLFANPEEGGDNLLRNGDFDEGTYRVENLWDGVDSSNRLKVWGHSAPVVADINGDGKKDIICGEGERLIFIYENSGTNESPQFTVGKFIQARFDWHTKPQVVDWDGDGKMDIIFGSQEGWVYFLENEGGRGKWEFVRRPGEPTGEFIEVGKEKLDIGQFSAPAIFDWNQDGKKDLLLGEGTYSANSIYVYLNSGSDRNPKFKEGSRQYLAYGEGRMHLTPCPVDLDGDGNPDLVVGEDTGCLNLYLNKGEKERRASLDEEKVIPLEYGGRLRTSQGELKVGSMSTPFMVDWNEDGKLDLISGDSSGYIYLCYNEGTAEEPRFAQPIALTGTDVDKDIEMPANWSQHLTGHRGRIGSYIAGIDEDAYSGKYSLKVTCLYDYPGTMHINGSLKSPIENDVKYELTFYTKGDGARDCEWGIEWYETGIEAGKRYRSWPRYSEGFSVPSRWRMVRTSFKLSATESKRTDHSFWFYIRGNGTVWIDQVSLTKK